MALKLKSEKAEKSTSEKNPAKSKKSSRSKRPSKEKRSSKQKTKSKKTKTVREGVKVKGDGTYPNVPYLFDTMYGASKSVSYKKVADAVKKHFPDHKELSEASFERKKKRFENKGYNSKRWYNDNESKPKSKSRGKKSK